MSPRHPIIAITGSSGAGTTTVTTTFQQIFRREGVKAVIVYGDAFDHLVDRIVQNSNEALKIVSDGQGRHGKGRTAGKTFLDVDTR